MRSLQEIGLLANLAKYAKRVDEYAASPNRCERCDEILPYEKRKNKYCGHSCAATNINTGRKTVRHRVFSCKSCGCLIADGKVERVYCSLQCQADFEFAASYAKWLRGDGGPKTPKTLKRFLVERDGFRCDECGITDWNDKPICLELEHKSGNNDDDSPENLILLCPNCHSQTPTYKAKNRGNGRHARRVRYAEGLSY